MDTIDRIRDEIDKLMSRVHQLELSVSLTMQGQEEHIRRFNDFILRTDRSRDEDLRKAEKDDARGESYMKEMREKVGLLLDKDIGATAMRKLITYQWAALIGAATISGAATALFVALHH